MKCGFTKDESIANWGLEHRERAITAQIEIARTWKRTKLANRVKMFWEEITVKEEDLHNVKRHTFWECFTDGSGRKPHEKVGGWGLWCVQARDEGSFSPRLCFSRGGTVGGRGTNMMGEIAALREALSLAAELGRKFVRSVQTETF